MTAASHARSERIDLAHVEDFALGMLTIKPGVRQVVGHVGKSEVVEPRVMQVLVALWRADGAIVTREELTASCWEGRVVGEDAINRVISRLRRVAQEAGAASFRIETITKVGYRLLLEAEIDAAEAVRRRHPNPPPVDRVATRLMEQAFVLMGQDTPDASAQAIGLLRRAVELASDDADAWGGLALAYAAAALLGASTATEGLQLRAQAAAQRARAIDTDNVFAVACEAALLPTRGNWLSIEQMYRAALYAHPDNRALLERLGAILAETGRMQEAAVLIDRAAACGDPAPALLSNRVNWLGAAGRLEEADTASMQAWQLYPSHAGVWFSHVYSLMFTGRADQALAFMLAETRPFGIPEEDFELVTTAARAIANRRGKEVDRAVVANFAASHRGSGYAENAIQFCAALGQFDEAFAIADALYFGRGFEIPEHRFSRQQGIYENMANRRTWFLFGIATRVLRSDTRFESLVEELGLARSWLEAGEGPDYRI